MSKSTTLTVKVSCSGDEISDYDSTAIGTNTNAYGVTEEPVVLSAGNNSYTVPTNTTTPIKQVRFVCTTGSTNAKSVRGIAGDTGITGWTDGIVVLQVGSGQTYVINATAGETIRRTYF